MAVTQAQLEQLYLAYFGRPADFQGVVYYTSIPAATTTDVAVAFSTSAESQSLYGSAVTPAMINAIYNNLFNRDAEPAGLAYWFGVVSTGQLNAAGAALAILQGAQNADATAIQNKLAAATAFTNALDTTAEILGYSGDVAAQTARTQLHSVTSDSATLTTYLTNIDANVTAVVSVGGITGQTVTLTVDPDTFASANQTDTDTVKGIVDFTGGTDKSTFSVADKITGNDHTIVDIVVKSTNSGTVTGDFVTMSGIKELHLTNANTGNVQLNFDANSWTGVGSINLSGADNLFVQIKNLDDSASSAVKLDVAGGTTGTISLSKAHLGNWALNGSIENNLHNSVGAVASLGASGVDITLGKSGYAYFTISQTQTGQGAGVAATVGDIAVAHVTENVGINASVETMYFSNYAQATSAAATVGSISLGNVTLNAASGAQGYLTATNEAYVSAGKGAAKAGNVTVGSVAMTAATTAAANTAYLYNFAYSQKGAATVGNITAGAVDQAGTGYNYLYLENQASAAVSGAATAGSVTVGNVAMNNSGTGESNYLYVYNSATAHKGNATVGNVTLGNVTENVNYYGYVYVSNSAYAANTGTAVAGNITVGNVSLVAGSTGTGYLYLYDYAYAGNAGGKGGSAKVGDVTVGNVSMSVATSSNYLYIEKYAYNYGSKTHDTSVGNITVGTITMDQVAAAGTSYQNVFISQEAYTAHGNASAGNIVVGDINVNAGGITQVSGSNIITVNNYAEGSLTATVGSITIGNVTAKTGISGLVELSVSNWASGGTSDATGIVTVGNISMAGSKSATLEAYVHNYAEGTNDSAGGIKIGNVAMTANGASVYASFTVSQYASDGDVGSVTVGNVNLNAASVHLDITNTAANGTAGSLTVGSVSLKGTDGNGTNYIYQNASGAAGTVTVGDVTLTNGSGQTLNLDVENYSGSTLGTLTMGNITIAQTNKDTGATANSATLYSQTDGGKATGGNIVTGNITIGSSGYTTKATLAAAAVAAHVTLSSVDGTVSVGNITVTGGVKDTNGVVDNYGTLATWLSLTGSSVTIGNVDYSGYSAASVMDVHAYAGAATIKASKGGSTISDNKAANAIDLSANTTKADALYFASSQSGVKDSGGVVTATQTALDTITGFTTGDTIHVGSATTVVGIGGNGNLVQNTPSQDFATFLTHVEQQITTAGNSAYTAIIGGNTYVALNVAGKVGEIVEVMGSHTFNIAADTTGYDLVFLT